MNGYAGIYLDPQWPIVDHLHPRPQPHETFLQHITHRKPNLNPIVTQPDVDIRDTEKEYIIDVELPGLVDKKSVKLGWTSSRGLFLEGNVDRPTIDQVSKAPATEDSAAPTSDPSHTVLIVGERKIGPFRRHFMFPVDVDMQELTAKLESGLLTIRVPKQPLEHSNTGAIKIE